MGIQRIVCRVGLVVSLVPLLAVSPRMPEANPEPVPSHEYVIYDHVVNVKFLTSKTRLVLIQRQTVTRLEPDEQRPLSLRYFGERRLFGGQLSRDLLTDFVIKNGTPSRLDRRFGFGVRYRFVSPGGLEEPEVSLAPIPARLRAPPQADEPLETIGILAFTRVGFSASGDQALVYVEENRANATGAGFLIRLMRGARGWDVIDTEVLWVARPDG